MVRSLKILQFVSGTKWMNTNKLFLVKFCAFEWRKSQKIIISLPWKILSVLLTGFIIIEQRASSKYESNWLKIIGGNYDCKNMWHLTELD